MRRTFRHHTGHGTRGRLTLTRARNFIQHTRDTTNLALWRSRTLRSRAGGGMRCGRWGRISNGGAANLARGSAIPADKRLPRNNLHERAPGTPPAQSPMGRQAPRHEASCPNFRHDTWPRSTRVESCMAAACGGFLQLRPYRLREAKDASTGDICIALRLS